VPKTQRPRRAANDVYQPSDADCHRRPGSQKHVAQGRGVVIVRMDR
jgi:hypothetical protein